MYLKTHYLVLVILLIVSCGFALQIGAWVGGDGDYPQPTGENVTAFENLQGRSLDYIVHFAIWDSNDWTWVKPYADIAEAHGAKLVITWMPNGYAAPDIIAGGADEYIRNFAVDVKAYGKEVWLRPLHEANGSWYDWCVGKKGSGNTNANLIEAWKHIVSLFREQKVDNVKWVWTTNATNEGTGTSFTGTYPGDEWVDYISIDGYNWGTAQDWSSWKSFSAVFTPSYRALEKINKPIFIAEIASSEHGGDKAQWIQDMFADLAEKFPRIFALMWFHQSKSHEADWAVNTSESALAAWKAGVAQSVSRLADKRGTGMNVFVSPGQKRYFDLLGRR